ncbi:hypothetical protein [Jiella avicenniae]|uniref:Uncharacterized protein n=1 Tax=Jiella avicenniae TaxID=2907202 RepID=A0A9X1P1S5_9HYPH|nr:hypothetical protein [Jiella avicenniae]MCE7029842.1 hypothetical protein [Jiella avicenniae]
MMVSKEQLVVGNTGKIIAISLILAGVPAMAAAQDAKSTQSYEVSSLRLTSLPVPTSRASALGIDTKVSEQRKIRRTADGIRIVGPVFFPEDRQ